MRCNEFERLSQEVSVVFSRLHDAALGKEVQGRADWRAGDADEIGELLLTQMMARFQSGVANDVQELIGQMEAALTGGGRHDQSRL